MARKNVKNVSCRTLSDSDYRFERKRESGRKRGHSCKHSTGNVGELIVYVNPSCPMMSMIKGSFVSSVLRCAECEHWEESQE
ncbi:MAG: hypothetical protein SO471_17960 [Anaerobutyricum hallii]|uniref:hypothetical protein n=1 Tax=Anaerobutyricum hallii TaxID=39488 RepID=UPI002A83150D|nr:hypothetical protein [Anaerobutyricum hallii]MDY4579790.1 hypothetical protein [Anaerobutyricum hallii]